MGADYSSFKQYSNKVGYLVSEPTKDKGLQWQEGEDSTGRQSDSKQIRVLGAGDSFSSPRITRTPTPSDTLRSHLGNVLSQPPTFAQAGLRTWDVNS